MVNFHEVIETNRMIQEANLDVRTITMGISLLDCAHSDYKVFHQKVYDKITRLAQNLVATGDEIGNRFGIPIVNKRISITPAAICASACDDPIFRNWPRLWIGLQKKWVLTLSVVFLPWYKRV